MANFIKAYAKQEKSTFGTLVGVSAPELVALDQIVRVDESSFIIKKGDEELKYHPAEITTKQLNKRFLGIVIALGVIAIVMLIVTAIYSNWQYWRPVDNYDSYRDYYPDYNVCRRYNILKGISSSTNLIFIGSLFFVIPFGKANKVVYIAEKDLNIISD